MAVSAWRNGVAAWRNGVSAKRTDTKPWREHVSLVDGFDRDRAPGPEVEGACQRGTPLITRAAQTVPPRVMAKYALMRVNDLIGSSEVIAGRRTRISPEIPELLQVPAEQTNCSG